MNIVRAAICFSGGMVLGYHAVHGSYALALVGAGAMVYGVFFMPTGDNR